MPLASKSIHLSSRDSLPTSHIASGGMLTHASCKGLRDPPMAAMYAQCPSCRFREEPGNDRSCSARLWREKAGLAVIHMFRREAQVGLSQQKLKVQFVKIHNVLLERTL